MSCPQKNSQNSQPAINSALNIFSTPPTNISVNRSFFREVLPLNTISQESPYLFRLFNDNLWSDMSRVYLYLKLSIEQQKDGAWIPLESETVGSIQSVGQTFIQQLKVSVGTTEIYDSGTLYPYKAYFTNELSYGENVKQNFLSCMGYHHSLIHNDITDAGYLNRVKIFENGKSAEFLSRLDFDLGNQEQYLINNIDVLFTLYRSKNEFLLQSKFSDTNIYRLFLHSIKLYVKMIDVQPSLNLSIYSRLEKQPALYALRKTEVKSYFLTPGRTEVDHNIFSSVIPRRLTIAMVNNKAFNGNIYLSPFNFQPFGIREICVTAGSLNFPAVPYNLDFTNNEFIRAFVDMYEALGAANSNEKSCDISYNQFKDGWTFFIVSLTSTLDDTCGFELLKSGTTTIRMRFNEPIPKEGVEMIVLGEFDQLLSIDLNRRVISDSDII